MEKYIFAFNIDNAGLNKWDDLMVQTLECNDVDFIVKSYTTLENIEGRSIWIKQSQFVESMKLLDDFTTGELVIMFVRRSKNEKYFIRERKSVAC